MSQPQQEIPDTFEINVGYPIQCFTLNSQGNKVITAGRTECNLFWIEENEFRYRSNFQLTSNRLRNLCIMDICWSRKNENLAVTCGSNGELHRLAVTPSEITLDDTFQFHERTINKINFHPNEENLLISGGQDGIIKLIDFRCRTDNTPMASFMHDNEDKVTDIQFNPSTSKHYQFASGSFNGHTYIWDTRNPTRFERHIKPHLSVVHLDWHPEDKFCLATASRDKQIYIWDLSSNRTNLVPKNSVTHLESVISIKWRPKRHTQITACSSSGFDAHLYVWDTQRPYVPYASFESLSNRYNMNFSWRNPKVLIASSRQFLFSTRIAEAIRPADYSTLMTLEIDKQGSIAFAVGINDDDKVPGSSDGAPLPVLSSFTHNSNGPKLSAKLSITSSLSVDETTKSNPSLRQSDNNSSINIPIGGPQPTLLTSTIASSQGSTSSINLNVSKQLDNDQLSLLSDKDAEKFRITKSVLNIADQVDLTKTDWFYAASTNYKFKDKSFDELCEHNAQIAMMHKKFDVFKDWMILKTIYKDDLVPSKVDKLLQEIQSNQEPNSNSESSDTTKTAVLSEINPTNVSYEPQIIINNDILCLAYPPTVSTATTSASNISTISSTDSSSRKSSSSSRSSLSDEFDSTEKNLTQTTIQEMLDKNRDAMSSFKQKLASIEQSETNEITMKSRGDTMTSSKSTSNYYSVVDLSENHHSHHHLHHHHSSFHHNHHNYDMLDDIYMSNNPNYRNIDSEEETRSYLPNDIIEYNDESIADFISNSVNNLLSITSKNNKRTVQNDAETTQTSTNETKEMLPFPFKSTSTQPAANFHIITDLASINENQLSSNETKTKLNNPDTNKNSVLNEGMTLALNNNKSIDDILLNINENLTSKANKAETQLDMNSFFQNLIQNYVNDCDLPTAIFMYLVTTKHGKFDGNTIESTCSDEWFSQYIELLSKFELWNLRIEIINEYQSDFIKNLTQQSINYGLMCAKCKKTIKSNTYVCSSCNKNIFICSFCHLPVKYSYVWCHNCCHGGHINHIVNWFQKYKECPTGCGCKCVYSV